MLSLWILFLVSTKPYFVFHLSMKKIYTKIMLIKFHLMWVLRAQNRRRKAKYLNPTSNKIQDDSQFSDGEGCPVNKNQDQSPRNRIHHLSKLMLWEHGRCIQIQNFPLVGEGSVGRETWTRSHLMDWTLYMSHVSSNLCWRFQFFLWCWVVSRRKSWSPGLSFSVWLHAWNFFLLPNPFDKVSRVTSFGIITGGRNKSVYPLEWEMISIGSQCSKIWVIFLTPTRRMDILLVKYIYILLVNFHLGERIARKQSPSSKSSPLFSSTHWIHRH